MYDTQVLLPLHPSQENICLEQMLFPDQVLYNIGGYQLLEFAADFALMQQCWTLLHQHIDALRLRIVVKDSAWPQQWVASEPDPVLEYVDFSAADEPQQAALRWMQQRNARPMDFRQGDTAAAAVLKLAGQQYYLFVRFHHIIIDGMGCYRLMEYWHKLYHELQSGLTPDWLAGIPQYQPKVLQAQAYLHSRRYAADRQYWLQQFQGREISRLPAYYQTPGNGVLNLSVAPQLCRSLQQFSVEHSLSPLVLLLAAVNLLLRPLLQSSQIDLAVAVHGRSSKADKQVVGMLAETACLTCETDACQSFMQLATQAAKALSQALRHYKFPASHLARLLNLNTDRLADVLVGFESYQHELADDGRKTKTSVFSNLQHAQPLAVRLFDFGFNDGWVLKVTYARRYFCDEEAAQLARRLLQLLAHGIRQPQSPLSQLPLLLAEEQAQLQQWHRPPAPALPDLTLHQLFARQVAKTPEQPALQCAGTSLTYRQLEQRANQLARHIRRHYQAAQHKALAPDSPIALYFEPGPDMVISILAVLKAGGAYVPLSPKNPPPRSRYILTDSAAPLLLTTAALAAELTLCLRELSAAPQLLCVDTLADEDTAELPPYSSAKDLAYIIYTSGTTGQPKGVMIEHRSIVSSTCCRLAYYPDCTAFLWLSQYAFDSSLAGLFGTLCSGATLVVSPDQEPATVLRLLHEQQISHMLLTPSHYFALFSGIVQIAPLLRLQAVIVAGEPLRSDNYQRHQQCLPQVRLYNEYGPTENSVWTSVQHCQPGGHLQPNVIGKPVANSSVYLLDAAGQPVFNGCPGELYISGCGLARGYLNQPALTAERFVSWPAPGDDTGTVLRLYKTGDWARRLPNGDLEYLARQDHQVKIRGYRVELSEIAAVLTELPAVGQAVVVQDAAAALAAYVVPEAGHPFCADALRQALQGRLPDYMVPASFTAIDTVPLTLNGKLDTNALPAPASVVSATDAVPADSYEQYMFLLWQELLNGQSVGRSAHFFALGGNSLLLIQLSIRLKADYQVEISVMDLFHAKTPVAMATLLRAAHQQAGPHPASCIHLLSQCRAKARLALLCLPYAGADALVFQALANALPEDIVVYAVTYPGQDTAETDDAGYAGFFNACAAQVQAQIRLPVAIVGHCLGAAVALKLQQVLLQQNISVQALLLSAFTLSAADLCPQQQAPQPALALMRTLLVSAGVVAAPDQLTDAQWALLSQRICQDMALARWCRQDFLTHAFAQKIPLPVYNIIAKDDPLTSNYRQHTGNWQRISDDYQLIELEQGGHYFIQTPSEALQSAVVRICRALCLTGEPQP